jgi:AraC-like DNA-binding protein
VRHDLFRAPSLGVPQWPVSDRARDRALLESSLAFPCQFSTEQQPYPRGTGVRVRCDEVREVFGRPIGEGYSDFVQLASDLSARIVNARVAHRTGVRCLGEDWLKIEVYTSGRQSLVFQDVGQIDLASRWCQVHLHPEGVAKGDWMAEGTEGRGLVLYLRPEFFRNRLAEDLDALPAGLKQFASGRGQFFFETLPVPYRMARAVANVVSTPLVGSLRRLYVEANAIDIATQVISGLRRAPDPPLQGCRPRDIECLHHARSILEREFFDPPSILDLARRVGINQQKLKCGFKALFGATIFEFYQNLRLTMAADMLEAEHSSVSEAALAAGYQYASNFAVAFRRKFGVSPREFKQRRR